MIFKKHEPLKNIPEEWTKRDKEDRLPYSATIELRWSKDKSTTQIIGLDKLPKHMVKRLAGDVFDKLNESDVKIRMLFW